MTKEHRRSSRVRTRLWVHVPGISETPTLRAGDISMTGIYFEFDQDLGAPGAVHAIELESADHARKVKLSARVIRVIRMEDIWVTAPVAGIAMEFLPDCTATLDDIEQLVRHIAMRTARMRSATWDFRLDGEVVGKGAATIARFGRRSMILDSPEPIELGEPMSFQAQTPRAGNMMSLNGFVVGCRKVRRGENDRFEVEIEFGGSTEETHSPAEIGGQSLDDAIDSLLEETLVPTGERAMSEQGHIAGSLDRVGLTSILGFLELEKHTGTLRVNDGQREVELSLAQGRLINASGTADLEPRALAREVLTWRQGQFSFEVHEARDGGNLDLQITALMLDAAREDDEGTR